MNIHQSLSEVSTLHQSLYMEFLYPCTKKCVDNEFGAHGVVTFINYAHNQKIGTPNN